MAGRGRFRIINGGRRSDPPRFSPEARRKSGWLRFAPLWGGAVGVGLLIGVGWAYLPDGNDGAPSSRTTTIDDYVDELDRSGNSPSGDSGSSGGVSATFSFCHTGGGYNCVVDGDTIYLKGVKIRIADIDAPETHDFKCAEEKSLGDRATQRLIGLVNSGEVTLAPIDRDEDSYGRKLRIVKVDSVSIGVTLVDEGFARWYAGGRRPWC